MPDEDFRSSGSAQAKAMFRDVISRVPSRLWVAFAIGSLGYFASFITIWGETIFSVLFISEENNEGPLLYDDTVAGLFMVWVVLMGMISGLYMAFTRRDIFTRVPIILWSALGIGSLLYFIGLIAAFTGGTSASEMLKLDVWKGFFDYRAELAKHTDAWFLYGTNFFGFITNWLLISQSIIVVYLAYTMRSELFKIPREYRTLIVLGTAGYIVGFVTIWGRTIVEPDFMPAYWDLREILGFVGKPLEYEIGVAGFFRSWLVLLGVIAGLYFFPWSDRLRARMGPP